MRGRALAFGVTEPWQRFDIVLVVFAQERKKETLFLLSTLESRTMCGGTGEVESTVKPWSQRHTPLP